FFLDFWYTVELDDVFASDIELLFNVNYAFTLEDGILGIRPHLNHYHAEGTSAEDVVPGIERGLTAELPSMFSERALELQLQDLGNLSCKTDSADACSDIAGLFGEAIRGGSRAIGLTAAEGEMLVRSANSTRADGRLANWLCRPDPTLSAGRGRCS